MKNLGLAVMAGLALASEAAAGDLLSYTTREGTVVSLEAAEHSASLVARAGGKTLFRRDLGGARPVSLLAADLAGTGAPLLLATLQEEGSGGYGRHLLVQSDGRGILWESAARPGGAAAPGPDGRGFRLAEVLKGERPEGDLERVSSLRLKEGKPVLEPAGPMRPAGGWQFLTAGLESLRQGEWKDAVTFLTQAVDAKEGKAEPLGAAARHHLARALVLDGQLAMARSILLGLRNRFPASSYAPEAKRTLALMDQATRSGDEPLVLLYQAQEALGRNRWEDAGAAAEKLLAKHATAGLSDRAHYVLGRALSGAGKAKEAVKHFQTVVLYFPSSEMRRLAQEEIARLELQ